ncbi:MAG: SURF1 family protein [Caldilineaceae bacterium]|nr:SURF1 family protein [Caldilineaceae bacterium]
MTVGLPKTRTGLNFGVAAATLALLFGRRWWWKTLLVLLAMGVMVVLGFWQLDRLEQRRAFNQQRRAALAAAPIELTGAPLPLPLAELRDRQAVAVGEFDYARQVAVRNQNLDGRPGHHLVTPLVIAGSNKAVLVNRGWIPADQANPGTWRTLDERSNGPQSGILKPTVLRPDGAVSAIPQDAVTGWYRLDVEAIGQTLPYELMPVVLQLLPAESYDPSSLPRRIQSDSTFSEGNHFSYALQWFGFAITAAVVYVAVARRQS